MKDTIITSYTQIYNFKFLNLPIQIECYNQDLLFLINFMTLIEIHGSAYWERFNRLNSGEDFDPYDTNHNNTYFESKLNIPNNLRKHIIDYLPMYERENNIDSVLL